MIKRINSKFVGVKQNSILDFIKDMKGISRVEHIPKSFLNKKLLRSSNKKAKSFLTMLDDINGQGKIFFPEKTTKQYSEDKENQVKKKQVNCHNKLVKSLAPLRQQNPNFQLGMLKESNTFIKIKKKDYYDELNGRNIKMNLIDEKDLPFTQSKILPKVKFMKLDNDVLTDSEQLQDAKSMMFDNLKDTIKLIENQKDYLNKNLSRKIIWEK
jgi:hypothetical protein